MERTVSHYSRWGGMERTVSHYSLADDTGDGLEGSGEDGGMDVSMPFSLTFVDTFRYDIITACICYVM